MRKLFLSLFIASLAFIMGSGVAHAGRLGGGMSFGKQKYDYSRQYAPARQTTPAQTTPNQNTPRTPASAGSRSWLGPLAGLAAGGLLAAMLFGDHFEGLQLLDILLFAMLGWMLLTMLRSRTKASAATSTGHHAPMAFEANPRAVPSETPAPTAFAPQWFDEQRFLQQAQMHYLNLQRAWDKADFSELAEYFTPEMLEMLKAERQNHPLNNQTDVQHVETFLLDLTQENGLAVASVRFDVDLMENGHPVQAAEIWHIVRDLEADNSPWLIAGIQAA